MKILNWEAILWDCLEEMDKLIEQWVKVDAIITDPPIKNRLDFIEKINIIFL